MLDKIFYNTSCYAEVQKRNDRKEKGQFFTAIKTARFMASFCAVKQDTVSILDPGAGNGSLSSALIEELSKQGIKEISVDFVENDDTILPLLQNTIKLQETFCEERGIKYTHCVMTDNFILHEFEDKYDLIISNPPYKKIRKESPEAVFLQEYVYGQPNIYSLFISKSITLLKDSGQMIFIVPRSWTSGVYFIKLREQVFAKLNITRIHIFAERDDSFSGEDVLQETMIFSARKMTQQTKIIISSSSNDTYKDIKEFEVESDIVLDYGSEHYLLIPTTEQEASIITYMKSKQETFSSLGFIFKTGPVVEFRNRGLVFKEESEDRVPMYRSANVRRGQLVFPAETDKAQYISNSAGQLLVDNANTVLVKRLSSKEERRRLQSCIYFKHGNNKYISFENHVNYVAKKDGTFLTEEEVTWIQSILSSEEYDRYFRIVNGSTQVNAKDLNMLPV